MREFSCRAEIYILYRELWGSVSHFCHDVLTFIFMGRNLTHELEDTKRRLMDTERELEGAQKKNKKVLSGTSKY